MAEPYEILAAPFDVYLAPVGTAFPEVDATPGVSWDLLGTNGAANYAEDGITVTHDQTIEIFRGLRGTGPVKAFRTAETLSLGFVLHDVSLEQYAKAINDATVTDNAAGGGNAGFRELDLHQGPDVAVFALLCKSPINSPYGDGMAMQYEVPKVYQGANPTLVYRKGQPAGLAITFTVLEDLEAASDAERFGRLVAQDAAAS
jgi:hypothetical protein